MSREIKFRGRLLYDLASGEQKMGDFFYWALVSEYVLNVPEMLNVGTIGQYTGLKDKNGVEMYDGDLLRLDGNEKIWTVQWESSWGGWSKKTIDEHIQSQLGQGSLPCEVIGNIYESPELLKEGAK